MEGASITDHLGDIFDKCDESKAGQVRVSELFSFIYEHYLPARQSKIGDSQDNVLGIIKHKLDPDSTERNVDRVTWLAAWEPYLHTVSDNSGWGATCDENNDLDSLPCSVSPLDESQQSFTYSPGSDTPGSDTPATTDCIEANICSLCARRNKLLQQEAEFRSSLEIEEDALYQEQIRNKELSKNIDEKLSAIARLKQEIRILEESTCELKSSLYASEKEKLDLCREICEKEELVRLHEIDKEALHLEVNTLTDELGKTLTEKVRLSEERDKLREELQEQQSVAFSNDDKLTTLIRENKSLKDSIDQLKFHSKMEKQLLNVSFDELEEIDQEPCSQHSTLKNVEKPAFVTPLPDQHLTSISPSLFSISNCNQPNSLFEELANMEPSNVLNSDMNDNLNIMDVELLDNVGMQAHPTVSGASCSSCAECNQRQHGKYWKEVTDENEEGNQEIICKSSIETCNVSVQTKSISPYSWNNVLDLHRFDSTNAQEFLSPDNQNCNNYEKGLCHLYTIQDIDEENRVVPFHTNITQYSKIRNVVYSLLLLFINVLLIMFLTLMCTISALESMSPPLPGNSPQWVPKWFRTLFKYLVTIDNYSANLPF